MADVSIGSGPWLSPTPTRSLLPYIQTPGTPSSEFLASPLMLRSPLDLESPTGTLASSPLRSQPVTSLQSNAAGAILHGDKHESEAYADAKAAKGAKAAFKVGEYANIAVETLGHKLQHGAHGHGHAPTPVAEVQPPPPKLEPQAPPRPAPPPVQVREATGEMAEMVENMKRNGADIPEPSKRVQPLRQPSGEMAEYVENIRAAEARDLEAQRAQRQAAAPVAEAPEAPKSVSSASAHKGPSTSAKVGTALGRSAVVAEGVLGPLGVYYGAKEIKGGLQDMQEANSKTEKFDAGARVAMGTGMAAGGATGIAGVTLGALGVSGAAQVLGKASVVAAGGVAVVDGVKDMVHGVQDKDLGTFGRGGLKTAAGGAMLAGVATANPVLIVGGAATYAGVTLYENREAIKAFAGNVADGAVAVGKDVKDGAVHYAGKAWDKASEVTGSIGSGLGSAWKTATSWW